jgi:hypothetical protein
VYDEELFENAPTGHPKQPDWSNEVCEPLMHNAHKKAVDALLYMLAGQGRQLDAPMTIAGS